MDFKGKEQEGGTEEEEENSLRRVASNHLNCSESAESGEPVEASSTQNREQGKQRWKRDEYGELIPHPVPQNDNYVNSDEEENECSCPSKRQRIKSVECLDSAKDESDIHMEASRSPPEVFNPGFEILTDPVDSIPDSPQPSTSRAPVDDLGEPFFSPNDLDDDNSCHAIAETLKTSANEKSTFRFGNQGRASDFSVVVFDLNTASSQSSKDNQSTEKPTAKACLLKKLSSVTSVFTTSQDSALNTETLADTSNFAVNEGPAAIECITELPAHLVVEIFRNLSMQTLLWNVSLVCKSWYVLARDASLWRNINLQHQLYKVDDEVLWRLTSLSDRVTYLNLCDTKLISTDCVSLVIEKCQYLQTLVLTRCFSVSDEVLESIGRSCHQLLNLHVEGCYKISDKGLLEVSAGCPRLRQIHLSRCHNITDKGVCIVADRCRLLQQITLEHCREVTDKSVRELAEKCPDLEFLSLMYTRITDDSIKYLRKMSKLTVLDISSNPRITASSIGSITQYCTKLECINVSLNEQLDDDCIIEIVRCGRELKKLYCVSCAVTDRALIKIGEYTKTLMTLDIGWCKEVTDTGVCRLSATCPTLQYLGLIRCDKVTANAIEELVAAYPNINYSTFILESRKLIEKAVRAGFQFNDGSSNQPT